MKTPLFLSIALGLLAGGLPAPAKAAADEYATPPGTHHLAIGDPAPDFCLPGVDGKTYTLADFKDSPYLMVIFLCNHCKISHACETRLIPFVAEMKSKGLAVVAINSDNDSGIQIDELGYSGYGENFKDSKAYARAEGFDFPYLWDGDKQTTAMAYGALGTPHVFLFDQERHLRYQGRFDDSRYPDPASVHSSDAINAVNALLAGKPVPVEVTRPIGCSIKWLMKHETVEQFNEAWRKLPVSVEPIDASGVAALVHNPTTKLRLINVWATWCGPCVEEFPSLVMISRRLERRRDFELITISMDDPKDQAKVERFLERDHAATPPLDKPSVLREGRQTNNYLFTGSTDELAKVLDPKWPGPLPYTVLVAPGGAIMARWEGQIDGTRLLNQLYATLGVYATPELDALAAQASAQVK